MYKKGDVIRLLNGETCKVIGIPGSFLSNGSYEIISVELQIDGKYKETNKIKRWIKPDDIAYNVTKTDNSQNNLDNYMEVVFDGDQIILIPKDIKSVELLVNENGFKTIQLVYEDRKHKTISILIGENEIINNK